MDRSSVSEIDDVDLNEVLPEPLRAEALADPKLAQALKNALRKAKRAWPTLSVPLDAFFDFLAARIAENKEALVSIRALHIEDLYFACACWLGDAKAAMIFQTEFWPQMTIALKKASASTLDDLRQIMWCKVFVDDHTKTSARVHQYRGNGGLVEWLRIATVRQYIDEQRRRSREELTDDDDILHQKILDQDPELGLMQVQYAAELQQAIATVMAELSVRERNILRFHLVEHMSIDQICVLYRAHRATVARWIVQSKNQLIKKVYQHLKTKLNLNPHELQSLMRMIKSNFQGSLRHHLISHNQ